MARSASYEVMRRGAPVMKLWSYGVMRRGAPVMKL